MAVPRENLKKSSVYATLKNEAFHDTIYGQLDCTPTATGAFLAEKMKLTKAQVQTVEGKAVMTEMESLMSDKKRRALYDVTRTIGYHATRDIGAFI